MMKKVAGLLFLALPLIVQPVTAGEWKTMSTAPRDGTPIEIMVTYGNDSWSGTFQWITEFHQSFKECTASGVCEKDFHSGFSKPYWRNVNKPNHGVDCDLDGARHCHWRLAFEGL